MGHYTVEISEADLGNVFSCVLRSHQNPKLFIARLCLEFGNSADRLVGRLRVVPITSLLATTSSKMECNWFVHFSSYFNM